MFRFAALSDSEGSESEHEDNAITFSRELPSKRSSKQDSVEQQEAKALQEYEAALILQAKGELDEALAKLNDLLETPIIKLTSSASPRITTRRGAGGAVEFKPSKAMTQLRYLVLKNSASILESKRDITDALERYIRASEIDGTDITLWLRIGNLAWDLNALFLALRAYERGIGCNPRHWLCVERRMDTLFLLGDYSACRVAAAHALQELDAHWPHPRALLQLIGCEEAGDEAARTLLVDRHPSLQKLIAKRDAIMALTRSTTAAAAVRTVAGGDALLTTVRRELKRPTWDALCRQVIALHRDMTRGDFGFATPIEISCPAGNALMAPSGGEISTPDGAAADAGTASAPIDVDGPAESTPSTPAVTDTPTAMSPADTGSAGRRQSSRRSTVTESKEKTKTVSPNAELVAALKRFSGGELPWVVDVDGGDDPPAGLVATYPSKKGKRAVAGSTASSPQEAHEVAAFLRGAGLSAASHGVVILAHSVLFALCVRSTAAPWHTGLVDLVLSLHEIVAPHFIDEWAASAPLHYLLLAEVHWAAAQKPGISRKERARHWTAAQHFVHGFARDSIAMATVETTPYAAARYYWLRGHMEAARENITAAAEYLRSCRTAVDTLARSGPNGSLAVDVDQQFALAGLLPGGTIELPHVMVPELKRISMSTVDHLLATITCHTQFAQLFSAYHKGDLDAVIRLSPPSLLPRRQAYLASGTDSVSTPLAASAALIPLEMRLQLLEMLCNTAKQQGDVATALACNIHLLEELVAAPKKQPITSQQLLELFQRLSEMLTVKDTAARLSTEGLLAIRRSVVRLLHRLDTPAGVDTTYRAAMLMYHALRADTTVTPLTILEFLSAAHKQLGSEGACCLNNGEFLRIFFNEITAYQRNSAKPTDDTAKHGRVLPKGDNERQPTDGSPPDGEVDEADDDEGDTATAALDLECELAQCVRCMYGVPFPKRITQLNKRAKLNEHHPTTRVSTVAATAGELYGHLHVVLDDHLQSGTAVREKIRSLLDVVYRDFQQLPKPLEGPLKSIRDYIDRGKPLPSTGVHAIGSLPEPIRKGLYYYCGKFVADEDEYDKCVSLLTHDLAVFPRRADTWATLAARYRAAAAPLLEELARTPLPPAGVAPAMRPYEYPDATYLRAKRRIERALRCYSRAVDLCPDDAALCKDYALTLLYAAQFFCVDAPYRPAGLVVPPKPAAAGSSGSQSPQSTSLSSSAGGADAVPMPARREVLSIALECLSRAAEVDQRSDWTIPYFRGKISEKLGRPAAEWLALYAEAAKRVDTQRLKEEDTALYRLHASRLKLAHRTAAIAELDIAASYNVDVFDKEVVEMSPQLVGSGAFPLDAAVQAMAAVFARPTSAAATDGDVDIERRRAAVVTNCRFALQLCRKRNRFSHRPVFRLACEAYRYKGDAAAALDILGRLFGKKLGRYYFQVWKAASDLPWKYYYYVHKYAELYLTLLSTTVAAANHERLDSLAERGERPDIADRATVAAFDAWCRYVDAAVAARAKAATIGMDALSEEERGLAEPDVDNIAKVSCSVWRRFEKASFPSSAKSTTGRALKRLTPAELASLKRRLQDMLVGVYRLHVTATTAPGEPASSSVVSTETALTYLEGVASKQSRQARAQSKAKIELPEFPVVAVPLAVPSTPAAAVTVTAVVPPTPVPIPLPASLEPEKLTREEQILKEYMDSLSTKSKVKSSVGHVSQVPPLAIDVEKLPSLEELDALVSRKRKLDLTTEQPMEPSAKRAKVEPQSEIAATSTGSGGGVPTQQQPPVVPAPTALAPANEAVIIVE